MTKKTKSNKTVGIALTKRQLQIIVTEKTEILHKAAYEINEFSLTDYSIENPVNLKEVIAKAIEDYDFSDLPINFVPPSAFSILESILLPNLKDKPLRKIISENDAPDLLNDVDRYKYDVNLGNLHNGQKIVTFGAINKEILESIKSIFDDLNLTLNCIVPLPLAILNSYELDKNETVQLNYFGTQNNTHLIIHKGNLIQSEYSEALNLEQFGSITEYIENQKRITKTLNENLDIAPSIQLIASPTENFYEEIEAHLESFQTTKLEPIISTLELSEVPAFGATQTTNHPNLDLLSEEKNSSFEGTKTSYILAWALVGSLILAFAFINILNNATINRLQNLVISENERGLEYLPLVREQEELEKQISINTGILRYEKNLNERELPWLESIGTVVRSFPGISETPASIIFKTLSIYPMADDAESKFQDNADISNLEGYLEIELSAESLSDTALGENINALEKDTSIGIIFSGTSVQNDRFTLNTTIGLFREETEEINVTTQE